MFIIVKGEIYLIVESNSNFCNELTEGLVFNKLLFSVRYLNLASSKILVEAVLYRVVLKCMSQITRPLNPRHLNIMCEDMGSQNIAVLLHTGVMWLLRGKMSF